MECVWGGVKLIRIEGKCWTCVLCVCFLQVVWAVSFPIHVSFSSSCFDTSGGRPERRWQQTVLEPEPVHHQPKRTMREHQELTNPPKHAQCWWSCNPMLILPNSQVWGIAPWEGRGGTEHICGLVKLFGWVGQMSLSINTNNNVNGVWLYSALLPS